MRVAVMPAPTAREPAVAAGLPSGLPGSVKLLLGAALLLAGAASCLGLLAPGVYHDSVNWTAQTRGIDLATLALACPLLVITILFGARRGAVTAALGVGLYLVYNYAIYTTSVAMNRLSLVYIAILGLSTWAAATLLLRLRDEAERPGGRLRRVAGAFLIAVAVLFSMLWLSQILATAFTGSAPADLVNAGLPANPVYALDLAIFLPLAALAGFGLWRERSFFGRLADAMLVWVFLTSAGIAGGFYFLAAGGATTPVPVAALVGIIALTAASLGIVRAVTPAGRHEHTTS